MKKPIALSDKSLQYLCDCSYAFRREINKENGRRPIKNTPISLAKKYINEVLKETERLGFKESEEIS